MTETNKKILIISIITAVLFMLTLIFTLVGVKIGHFNLGSISYLRSQYNLEKKAEGELGITQAKYYEEIKKIEESQEEYNKQKNKYEAISEETIEIIKEATREEKYNIEYMWITLGNYAKNNHLELVVVEPDGSSSVTFNNTISSPGKVDAFGSGVSASSNVVSGKNNTSTTNNQTTSNNNTTATTTTTTTTTTTSNTTNNTNQTTSTENTTTENNTSNTESSKSNSSVPVFKVQVTGTYMDTADFIFAVENDNTLRFKLDNISMDYVRGAIITTSFDVKNIVINKQ